MTIQQLEYIVALDDTRHFVRAAGECGVAQPTLSAMIRKLEEELGAAIFDRSRHPVEPTPLGSRLIGQARAVLSDMKRMEEMVSAETGTLSGPLSVGVIPTVAPYLIPQFIRLFRAGYPDITPTVHEMITCDITAALESGTLDTGVLATPLGSPKLLEIPLYYEKFAAYFPPDATAPDEPLNAGMLPSEGLWILREGHCMRSQIFNFCTRRPLQDGIYEAGSIDTLIRTVDANGGYTVIPELHLRFLSDEQLRGIRPIDSPPAVREISLVIRRDFVRERMLNAIADTVKRIIPEHMLDGRLKKYSIRL